MEEKEFLNVLQRFGIYDVVENAKCLECIYAIFNISYDRVGKMIEIRTVSQEFMSIINKIYKGDFFFTLFDGSFVNMDTNEVTYYVSKTVGFVQLLFEMKKYYAQFIQEKLLLLKKSIDRFNYVLDPFGTLYYGGKPTDLCSKVVYGSEIDIRMRDEECQDIRYYYNVNGAFSSEVIYNQGDMRIGVKNYLDSDKNSNYYGNHFLEISSCDKKNNQTKLLYNLSLGFGDNAKDKYNFSSQFMSLEKIDSIIEVVEDATCAVTDIISSKIKQKNNVKK